MTTTTADDVRGHGRRNPSDGSDAVSDDSLARPDDVVGHGSKRPTDEQADADDVRGHGYRNPFDGPDVLRDDASSQACGVGRGAGDLAGEGSVAGALDRWEKRLLETVLRPDL